MAPPVHHMPSTSLAIMTVYNLTSSWLPSGGTVILQASGASCIPVFSFGRITLPVLHGPWLYLLGIRPVHASSLHTGIALTECSVRLGGPAPPTLAGPGALHQGKTAVTSSRTLLLASPFMWSMASCPYHFGSTSAPYQSNTGIMAPPLARASSVLGRPSTGTRTITGCHRPLSCITGLPLGTLG